MAQATLNHAVADATLAMLPHDTKASAAVASLRPLLLWVVAGAIAVAIDASTMVSTGPRQPSLLVGGWTPTFAQVKSTGMHHWQAVSALQHTQPASLPAVPSPGAWLQAAAQQTAHAVALIGSDVSRPHTLVWLVVGVMVLQLLLWLAKRLLKYVLHRACSFLSLLTTLQVQRHIGIVRGARYAQDKNITQVATQPGLKQLLAKTLTHVRWSPEIRVSLFEDTKDHLTAMPRDILHALFSMPAVGASRPANMFADKPDPERRLMDTLSLAFIMLRCLAASPEDRKQFLSIMQGFVASFRSVQGDTFKTCCGRLYRNTHKAQYDELMKLPATPAGA